MCDARIKCHGTKSAINYDDVPQLLIVYSLFQFSYFRRCPPYV
jgi:hypothetical protein